KETLVYLIQTWLKINTTNLGFQCISIPCTESEFVGIFRDFINRYSPSSNRYLCVFQGPDAYETLDKLLNRSDWGTQKYQHGQETQVVLGELFENDFATDSKFSEQIQLQKTKSKCNKKDIAQLTIKWKKRTVTNNAKNKSFSESSPLTFPKKKPVKILEKGELTKCLNIQVMAFSCSAQEKIVRADGQTKISILFTNPPSFLVSSKIFV
ncbi:1331_t:CDS:2, partial [Gigaspora margarita]